ncbi:MAG: ATP-binding protein [Desulfobacula sp.]|jgi:hypothetical protein|uniref:AVAST type 4 anti-phage nuclease Avs4 n=1 Tax=Desulfobacula sp. TaxID=2593537 RepID=UPI001E096AEA|nr:ATP-binding protein [Desulfobacula sp.]MBT3486600.1 ATP-binding protein [Desulfobacula sp.]MBT3805695.1 ATP-binding protein [Desulfobacula sp.]MBT4023877.1 ATP-binding protein [Desulfobacula sp.]MBT4198997.1 ATP-binding protein [Desulfobacula sp.]
MIKPNWGLFKAKFNENPQDSFEWFCYLLFCREFDKPIGIFRYKNQSGIETEPIQKGDEIIGWQAKFYDSSLSSHKNEVISTIDKTSRDYPDLSNLLIYSNQEWGQNKGKKPAGLKEVEKKAKQLNIKIDWRTASFFESEFVTTKNEIISNEFFSFDKNIFNLIDDQNKHSENILNGINSSITFRNKVIEIDRSNQLEELEDGFTGVWIVSGVGGVGKTAVIKDFYQKTIEDIPIYIFKASEFEIKNIDDLFAEHSFYEFVKAHESETKVVIIDSAEKLLDLNNTEPFKEIISSILKGGWKVIFTTRENYLDDLNYEFLEIYQIVPKNINIKNLSLDELREISKDYAFKLPKDFKMLELIRNPFYLNEYLKFYNDEDKLDYSRFKDKLWNKNIKKSRPEREQCFLKLAFERSNSGQFFVNPDCSADVLDNELTKDGVLGYDVAGYFITHDIYEEWALERIIEKEFTNKSSISNFYDAIGQSLPIRRSFRSWLSEKLFVGNDEIKDFIEETLETDSLESFWKDEILISVLLSSYSDSFFGFYKGELLANNSELLKRIRFLLQIGCKEADFGILKQFNLKATALSSLEYFLTKPKGRGWEAFIKFILDNIDEIGINNLGFIIPILNDWNSTTKKGESTKNAGLIALKYYQWTIDEDVYFSQDRTKDNLIQTIVNSASEIEAELELIFQEIIKNGWKNRRDPYYDFSNSILTKIEAINVYKVFPNYVFSLAELFWLYTPKENRYGHPTRIEIGQHFGLESNLREYYPASAFQTPIYWLLCNSLKDTVDFILKFTNRVVEVYKNSSFDNSVEIIEIEVDGLIRKQYISNCLWNLYRGSGSPVSPYLLQSIHMALEKYFLENGKNMDSKVLESWLLYLLKNTKSASITSVVASIVLAYPEKIFNIAKILFKIKEFFLYDLTRMMSDQTVKGLYSIGYGLNYKTKMYADERIKTCDDKHRKFALEHIFLNYQMFRSEEISDEEANQRQDELWQILDHFYNELPEEANETDSDKTWRIFLSRMDRRKMKPKIKKTDAGTEIHFNPEIEPKLKEYSEKSLEKISNKTRYGALKLWATFRFEGNKKYKDYELYENDPNLALKETKEIFEKLKEKKDDEFRLFNHTIPAYVCSVLIRDFSDILLDEDRSFCKDLIIEIASFSLLKEYRYQISDGTQPAISVLPNLIEIFPEEEDGIKVILLFCLFNDYPIDMGNSRYSSFAISAIQNLWENRYKDANSLLLGYLYLKPPYEETIKKIREANRKKGIFEFDIDEARVVFLEERENDIKKIIKNEIQLNDISNFEQSKLLIQETALQLIPNKTTYDDHKKIVAMIISSFVKRLFSKDRDDRVDYSVKHNFLRKLAYLVLNAKDTDIEDYLKSFRDNLNASESTADFFEEFIWAEDTLNAYENFWIVWNFFKEKFIELCKDGDRHWFVDKIIISYLFTSVPWNKGTKEWHTLKNREKRFFKEILPKIGHCPTALYAVSKLLNEIGSNFAHEGIKWVSDILEKNPDIVEREFKPDTIFFMENFLRKYIYENREYIKRNQIVKNQILHQLRFMIEKESVIGYMLRESIL